MSVDFVNLANVVISGLLTGIVYGLMALGLSVIFGVARVVNFAHGEMMALAMYLAVFLFSTLHLEPFLSVAPVAVREQIPVSQPRVPQAGTHYVAPTHIFGVGAVTGSSRGFGGSARGWKAGRLGAQVEVSRFTYDSVDLLSRATVTDIAPGLLFALNDHVTDTLWVRPYVGAGAHFARKPAAADDDEDRGAHCNQPARRQQPIHAVSRRRR